MSPFRYLNSGLMKSVIYAPCTTQLCKIHLNINPMLKSVEAKLGLPEPPKKPLTGYFRFAKEIRPSLNAENPNLKATEMMSLIAEKWKLLADVDKDKFVKEYEEDKRNFKTKLTHYNNKLSEDDKVRIIEMKAEIIEKKIKSSKLKKREELGKPKQPMSPFLKYLLEQKDLQVGKHTKEEYWDYKRKVAAKWRQLSDAERQKYDIKEEMENYQKAMLEWEVKMLDLGHSDVVRKTRN